MTVLNLNRRLRMFFGFVVCVVFIASGITIYGVAENVETNHSTVSYTDGDFPKECPPDGVNNKDVNLENSMKGINDPCSDSCPSCGDIAGCPCGGGDGEIDQSDVNELLDNWGPCSGSCPADLNGDGTVNVDDLFKLLANWGSCPGLGCIG